MSRMQVMRNVFIVIFEYTPEVWENQDGGGCGGWMHRVARSFIISSYYKELYKIFLGLDRSKLLNDPYFIQFEHQRSEFFRNRTRNRNHNRRMNPFFDYDYDQDYDYESGFSCGNLAKLFSWNIIVPITFQPWLDASQKGFAYEAGGWLVPFTARSGTKAIMMLRSGP